LIKLKTNGTEKSGANVIKSKEDLVKQLVSYHTSQSAALQTSTKYIRYFLGAGGAYKMISTELGVITTEATSVQGVGAPKLGLKLTLPAKIPYSFFLQVYHFFKDVYELKGRVEAMVQIYWNRKKKEYFLYCPEQEVTAVHIDFKRNKDLDREHLLVADIHSHNDGPANFSTTDDSDEKEPRVYGVIGRVCSTPEVLFRVSTGDAFANIEMYDIFENPYPTVSYPNEWFEKCKPVTKWVASTYGSCSEEADYLNLDYGWERKFEKSNKWGNENSKYRGDNRRVVGGTEKWWE